MAKLTQLFRATVLSRPWLTFTLLCTCFGLFGAGTLNLFSMFSSNWDMITRQGLMSLATGSIWQLLELLATLALSMLFYVIFKCCEHSLVNHLLHPRDNQTHS
jgi:hypothetical protein